jgi:hypothetical protein
VALLKAWGSNAVAAGHCILNKEYREIRRSLSEYEECCSDQLERLGDRVILVRHSKQCVCSAVTACFCCSAVCC